MYFLFWLLRGCGGKVIYDNETMSEFKDYCQPNYKFLATEMRLSQLVVVFKNGDRVPLGRGGPDFGERQCVSCGEYSCTLKRCRSGLLTVKGYEQGRLLGQHIKNYYMGSFDGPVQITALSAPTSSALTALKSVAAALQVPEMTFGTEEVLGPADACEGLRKKYVSSLDNLGDSETTFDSSHVFFDQTIAGLCTDISVECEMPFCSLLTLRDALGNIQMQFEDQMARTRESIVVNGIEFSSLSRLIIRAVEAGGPLTLFAGGTSIVYTLLNGLNIAVDHIPSYGAAVFIEFWKHDDGKEYIRVVYGAEPMRFGLRNEDLMSKSRFLEYLTIFANKDDAIKSICALEDGTEKGIQHVHGAILKLFEKDQKDFSDFLTDAI